MHLNSGEWEDPGHENSAEPLTVVISAQRSDSQGSCVLLRATCNPWNQLTGKAEAAVSQQETESATLIWSRKVWAQIVGTLSGCHGNSSILQATNQLEFMQAQKQKRYS